MTIFNGTYKNIGIITFAGISLLWLLSIILNYYLFPANCEFHTFFLMSLSGMPPWVILISVSLITYYVFNDKSSKTVCSYCYLMKKGLPVYVLLVIVMSLYYYKISLVVSSPEHHFLKCFDEGLTNTYYLKRSVWYGMNFIISIGIFSSFGYLQAKRYKSKGRYILSWLNIATALTWFVVELYIKKLLFHYSEYFWILSFVVLILIVAGLVFLFKYFSKRAIPNFDRIYWSDADRHCFFSEFALNLIDDDGTNILFTAAEHNDTDLVTGLINKGIDINRQNYLRDTPLLYALRSNADEAAVILIMKGADYTIRNINDKTALEEIIINNKTDLLMAILDKGGEHIEDVLNEKLINFAASHHSFDVVRLLQYYRLIK